MRVVFRPSLPPAIVAAREIAERSNDECFTAIEIARSLGVTAASAGRSLDEYYEWGVCVRIDVDQTIPFTGDEKWCLIRHSLTVDREYEVLGIEADDYRILNDRDDPVLFSPRLFEAVDKREPSCWVSSYGEDGERYAYPPEWRSPGFFEQYHDRVEQVQVQFWSDLKRYSPRIAHERRRWQV